MAKQLFNEGLATHREGVYKPIDLIITDFQMPVKNGLQVVEEIQNLYRYQKIEVEPPNFVFCTAYATPVFSKHAQSVGVAHVYKKPMHIEDLSTLVREAIGES